MQKNYFVFQKKTIAYKTYLCRKTTAPNVWHTVEKVHQTVNTNRFWTTSVSVGMRHPKIWIKCLKKHVKWLSRKRNSNFIKCTARGKAIQQAAIQQQNTHDVMFVWKFPETSARILRFKFEFNLCLKTRITAGSGCFLLAIEIVRTILFLDT